MCRAGTSSFSIMIPNTCWTALPTLLKSYQEKGLKMVKVSEILLEGETTIDVQGKQHPTAVQDTSKER